VALAYATRNFVWSNQHWQGVLCEQELTQNTCTHGLVFQFPERHFCGGTILEELRLGHPELGSERVKQALREVRLIIYATHNSSFEWSTAPFGFSGS